MGGGKVAMIQDGVLVEAFGDAYHAADKENCKSISGGVLMVAGIVVGWMCKKQKCHSLSTKKAELVAASHMTVEMLGVVELLGIVELLKVGVPMQSAAVLHVDHQAATVQT